MPSVQRSPSISSRPPHERPPSGEHPTWPETNGETAAGRISSICVDLNQTDGDRVAKLIFAWQKCSEDRRVLIEATAREFAKIDPAVV